MNIREWILPVILAFATTFLIQRFVLDRYFKPQAAHQDGATEFIAPETQKAYKPLQLEVDFIDKEKRNSEEITEIYTSWGAASFSNHGACLQSLDFNHAVNGSMETIRTVFPQNNTEKETQCFLMALNGPTPYYYQLSDYRENDESAHISYAARFDRGTLAKNFVIYKHKCQIDLSCSCTLDGDIKEPVELRIVYPAPYMADIDTPTTISSVMINSSHKFERISRANLDTKKGWYAPEIFGGESTYFINAMIKDSNGFAQRAYYKLFGKDMLLSIVEGPSITTSTSWDLSFYVGPKEHTAIAAVDTRLEQALSYAGFFAPLAKLFIKILNFFYDYVGNYGLAIILLTLLIKLLFFPLTMGNDARMKKQQEMANKMTYLKHRFKDDPQRLAQEQAALIKEYGIPGAGCLPMLLQIPVFIAMRSVLAGSIELYHAPMLWIHDLSARDPYFILPLLLVIAMFVQAAYADKSQRNMLMIMGIVLGAFMANFAAGLVLYFVAHSLFSAIPTGKIRKWL